MSIIYSLKHNPNIYLNITNNCPNKCYFCFKHFWKGIGRVNLQLLNEPSYDEIIRQIQKAITRRCNGEIVFCGFGEPTTRLDIVIKVTKFIKKEYPNKIRLDTNGLGYKLNIGRDVVDELKNAGIDRVCVSINAFNKELYNNICKPEFNDSFDSILYFINKSKNVFDTEITAVTINEVDMKEMEKFAQNLGVRLRIRKYIPTFY